jgi:hypothetical protein
MYFLIPCDMLGVGFILHILKGPVSLVLTIRNSLHGIGFVPIAAYHFDSKLVEAWPSKPELGQLWFKRTLISVVAG